MVTEVKTSDCWLCNHALLCPDGRIRCESTFLIAAELCDTFEQGGYKIYRPPPPPKEHVSRVKTKVKPVMPKRHGKHKDGTLYKQHHLL